MAKVTPITSKINQTVQSNNSPQVSNDNKKTTGTRNKIIGCTIGAAALGAAIVGTLMYKGKVNNKKVVAAVSEITTAFKEQMKEFPEDIKYRKNILNNMGLNEAEYGNLRPIIGPEEYNKVLKEFSDLPIHYTPGETLNTAIKDGYELSGANNRTYRATMHMHTVHSDGSLTVEELLDKSAKYADEVELAIKDNPEAKAKHAPFTLAITDHDTLEGCKEAVGIILRNPEKYKNLRVVLGCEMSVENKMLGEELNKPVGTHIIVNVINPFDAKLNKFLDEKKLARKDLGKRLIEECKQSIAEINPNLSKELSHEDAQSLFPGLKYGIINSDYSVQDYATYKVLMSECIQNNPEVSNLFKAKSIEPKEIDSNELFNKYINAQPMLGFEKYYQGLKKYTSEALGISEKDAEEKLVINDNTREILSRINTVTGNGGSKMELSPAYVDMEEAINLIKEQDSGYMTIAHPACINIGERLKHPENSNRCMSDIFRLFKKKGGDRALGAEIYYPYFGDLANSKEWLNSMERYTKENNLIPTGGLDSHGKNIFYSNK